MITDQECNKKNFGIVLVEAEKQSTLPTRARSMRLRGEIMNIHLIIIVTDKFACLYKF